MKFRSDAGLVLGKRTSDINLEPDLREEGSN